jgi:hypothetical protein
MKNSNIYYYCPVAHLIACSEDFFVCQEKDTQEDPYPDGSAITMILMTIRIHEGGAQAVWLPSSGFFGT